MNNNLQKLKDYEQNERSFNINSTEEPTKIYKTHLTLAMQNNIESQKIVANMLVCGTGVIQNKTQGYTWYRQAADHGDPEAQFLYGWYCLEHQNEIEGISYIERAMAQNYVDAIYDIAGFHYFGLYGVPCNLQKAISYYENAILLGKQQAFYDWYTAHQQAVGWWKTFFALLKNIFRFAKALIK